MLRSRTAAVVSLLLLPLVAGGFLLQRTPPRAPAHLFDQVLSIVANRYVDTLAAPDILARAARGLVRELNDPYSELLAPKQREEFTRSTGGRYGGVGMLLEEEKAGRGTSIVVRSVFPHTPAEEGGVLEGDRIMRVDSLSASDIRIDRVSDALRGAIGTRVTVTFARAGVALPVTLSFTRATIRVPAVPFSTIIADGIGYIPLQTFNENTADEVSAAATRLIRDGARGLVLDLRDNGGGIVDQALAVSTLFLHDGQSIVTVRARGTPDEVSRASGERLGAQPPLVVLTDGGSASASEIVAGALQDHDRALVVGTTSFGKGLVQSLFPLDGGYALKLTTGKWYTPSGRSIHRERTLRPDGQLVETVPDSLETEQSKRARPRFSSDAGRTIFGGGGITPDVIVAEDTLPTSEQELLRALAPRAQAFVTTLNAYALELKSAASPAFTVTPAWRAELLRRLSAAGVTIEPRFAGVAPAVLDRELDRRVARLALGDAGAKRRSLASDHPLARAVALLSASRTQAALLASVQARSSAAATARPAPRATP